MDTESVIQIVLISTAIILLYFLVRSITSDTKMDKPKYSGLARSPEELYHPSDEAISEMEELISKLN
ncbi:MAG TPA: hypothetical protein HA315_05380 [Candidatus Thalassarchaeaceae archaeon]|nr:hypothetical protein [Euryarchaeota archaeon]DAC42418.1 MAG TPA: hypothetical protein D7H72_05370 [Candidatus Poseidoniales archaeon]HII35409.1 hypothetical protein [Candidatus Thalassarchaeaceae archaeon]